MSSGSARKGKEAVEEWGGDVPDTNSMVEPELTVDDESKYNPASVDPALEDEEDKGKKPAIGGPRLQQGENLSRAPEPAGPTGEGGPHGQDSSPHILAAFVDVCVWEQNTKARFVEGTPPGADELKRWQKAKIAVLEAALASALATALGPSSAIASVSEFLREENFWT